jgi:hypothetical protein
MYQKGLNNVDFIKKSWQWIVGVLGAIVGLLLLRNYFQRDLKADAKNAETNLKSAVIDEKLAANAKTQADLNNAATGLIEALNKDLKDAESATPDEVESFWNRKK